MCPDAGAADAEPRRAAAWIRASARYRAVRSTESSTEEQSRTAQAKLPRCAWPSGSSPTWWVVHPNHGHLRRQRGRGCGAVSNGSAGRPGTYRRPGWTRTRAAASRCTTARELQRLWQCWWWISRHFGSSVWTQNRSVGAPSHV